MIESYSFGRIIIDGKEYTSDVIVFPSRVKDKWRRQEGHRLSVEDLELVVKGKPEVVVVGTGYMGLMKVLPETKKHLESNEIGLVAEKTRKACETYNQLAESRKVIAALHLTC